MKNVEGIKPVVYWKTGQIHIKHRSWPATMYYIPHVPNGEVFYIAYLNYEWVLWSKRNRKRSCLGLRAYLEILRTRVSLSWVLAMFESHAWCSRSTIFSLGTIRMTILLSFLNKFLLHCTLASYLTRIIFYQEWGHIFCCERVFLYKGGTSIEGKGWLMDCYTCTGTYLNYPTAHNPLTRYLLRKLLPV